jgi:hypothetical protein
MYHKARNTLVAAAVALAFLGAGYGAGNPPANDFRTGLELGSQASVDAVGVPARKRILGAQRHMAMPFFSFAPLLPRQGG